MGEPGKLLGSMYFPWLSLLLYGPTVSRVESIINKKYNLKINQEKSSVIRKLNLSIPSTQQKMLETSFSGTSYSNNNAAKLLKFNAIIFEISKY